MGHVLRPAARLMAPAANDTTVYFNPFQHAIIRAFCSLNVEDRRHVTTAVTCAGSKRSADSPEATERSSLQLSFFSVLDVKTRRQNA